MQPENFRDAYCTANACSPADFRRKIFLRCFFPFALPIGIFLLFLNAPTTTKALRAIDQLGDATCAADVNAAVNEYYRYIEECGGPWIRLLKVRLSGTRMIRLYHATMRQNPVANPPDQ